MKFPTGYFITGDLQEGVRNLITHYLLQPTLGLQPLLRGGLNLVPGKLVG